MKYLWLTEQFTNPTFSTTSSHIRGERTFRTIPCRNFNVQTQSGCRFGDRCTFLHGLRPDVVHAAVLNSNDFPVLPVITSVVASVVTPVIAPVIASVVTHVVTPVIAPVIAPVTAPVVTRVTAPIAPRFPSIELQFPITTRVRTIVTDDAGFQREEWRMQPSVRSLVLCRRNLDFPILCAQGQHEQARNLPHHHPRDCRLPHWNRADGNLCGACLVGSPCAPTCTLIHPLNFPKIELASSVGATASSVGATHYRRPHGKTLICKAALANFYDITIPRGENCCPGAATCKFAHAEEDLVSPAFDYFERLCRNDEMPTRLQKWLDEVIRVLSSSSGVVLPPHDPSCVSDWFQLWHEMVKSKRKDDPTFLRLFPDSQEEELVWELVRRFKTCKTSEHMLRAELGGDRTFLAFAQSDDRTKWALCQGGRLCKHGIHLDSTDKDGTTKAVCLNNLNGRESAPLIPSRFGTMREELWELLGQRRQLLASNVQSQERDVLLTNLNKTTHNHREELMSIFRSTSLLPPGKSLLVRPFVAPLPEGPVPGVFENLLRIEKPEITEEELEMRRIQDREQTKLALALAEERAQALALSQAAAVQEKAAKDALLKEQMEAEASTSTDPKFKEFVNSGSYSVMTFAEFQDSLNREAWMNFQRSTDSWTTFIAKVRFINIKWLSLGVVEEVQSNFVHKKADHEDKGTTIQYTVASPEKEKYGNNFWDYFWDLPEVKNPRIVGDDSQLAIEQPKLFNKFKASNFIGTFTQWLLANSDTSEVYQAFKKSEFSWEINYNYIRFVLPFDQTITITDFAQNHRLMTKWISSGASANNVSFLDFVAQSDEYLDYFQTSRLVTFEQFLQDKADGWVTATHVFHPKQKVKSPQQIAINFNNETGVATPAPLDPLGSVRLCRAPLQVAVSRGIYIDNEDSDSDSDSDSDTNSTVSEKEDADFVNPATELAYGINAVPRTPLQAAARFPLSGDKHYFFKSHTYKDGAAIKHDWILGPFKTKSDAKKAQSCISKVLKSTASVDTHDGELETYEVHFPFYQNHKSTTRRTTQQLDAVFAATLAHLSVPKRAFFQNISTA